MAERQAKRGEAAFLENLGGELAHVGATMLKLAETVAARSGEARPAKAPIAARQVGFLISMRHTRSTTFGLDLASPGWTVLLELYRARFERRPVRITRLATDAGIASTTALRWLDQLGERGLVERKPEPEDGRGVVVRLTGKGIRLMDDYFAALKTDWALG